MRRWQQIAAGVAVPAILVLGATTVVASDRNDPEARAARAAADQSASTAQLAPPPSNAQPKSESSYVPLTPCRIVDTRLGTGAYGSPLGNGSLRNYYVFGTVGFAPQGGKSGGCGVPVGATAVTAVVAAVSPANRGLFKAWPVGGSEPNATILNYAAQTTSTAADLALGSQGGKGLTLENGGGPTDVVIDVTGYYVKPLARMISPAGDPYSGSSRILAASLSGGVYSVQFDRDIRYCSAVASSYYYAYYAVTDTFTGSPDTISVRLFDANGASAENYFYVSVDC